LNKCDIGDHKVEKYCKKNNIPILLSIPLDKEIAVAYSKGIPISLPTSLIAFSGQNNVQAPQP
ncbi:unnamed protein product, partial [marine sediment metagenome]